jgi:hypothetical protein
MNTISQVVIAALTRTCLPPADEQATAASIGSAKEIPTRHRGSARGRTPAFTHRSKNFGQYY